ncbi:MAG: 50S ribosomal protein L15 [Actinomycetota bacterium]
MTLRINDLHPAPGSTHAPKRVGRGRSSGHGKTCGRGTKGQKARGKTRLGFEGGQMPLQRRLPKLRGFKPLNKKEFHLVNVEALNRFSDGDVVTPEVLVERGIIKKLNKEVKILGRGGLERGLKVKAHAFTRGAVAKIEAAGGSAEVV